jgi:hypothetical protein
VEGKEWVAPEVVGSVGLEGSEGSEGSMPPAGYGTPSMVGCCQLRRMLAVLLSC